MTGSLSVIIPSFNTGNYICDAVLSVANDVPGAEIIVVDDASTDSTVRNLKALRLPHLKTVVLAENSPGGAGHPSNIGINEASGEYIAFVDSDDFFMTGYLSGLIDVAMRHQADICVASYRQTDTITHKETPAFDAHTWNKFVAARSEGSLDNQSYFRLSPEPWRKIYRRSLFQDPAVRFPVNGWFNEDYPFHWLTGLRARENIAFYNNSNYLHRTSRAGQTTEALDSRSFFLFDHTEVIRNFIKVNQLARYEASLLNWLMIGAWKLKRISGNHLEYYERFKHLIMSFDSNTVEEFVALANTKEKNNYAAIVNSTSFENAISSMDM